MKSIVLALGLFLSTMAFGWTEVNEANIDAETGTATGIVVMLADDCEKCDEYVTILKKLENDYPALKFMYVDTDKNPLIKKNLAPVTPATYFLVNGIVVVQIAGSGTEENIRGSLDKLMLYVNSMK